MSEMVERVVEAMNASEVDWRDIDDASVTCLARTAIAAMREPTPKMISAGERTLRQFPVIGQPEKAWQAMIDAALKEGSE